jgi:type IV pilus assembly protein PilB
MNDKSLLDALVKKGILSQELAAKILQEASFSKKSAEDLLHNRRLADDVSVAQVKSEMLGVPYQKVKMDELTPELLKLIPEEIVASYHVIPLMKTKDMLVVGMARPDDVKAQDALRFIAKQLRVDLGVYLISLGDFEEVMRKYSPYKSEIEAALKSLRIDGKKMPSMQQIVRLEEDKGTSAEDAPVIKIVASTLREAVLANASDIHIEPQKNRLRIRFRIDGELQETSTLPVELHQPMVSRVKVLSNLKIDETRIPQDGRFRTVLFDRDIDFRVATFPTPTGEKVAIRVLDPTVGLKGLDDLGLVGRNREIFNEGIKKPFGMILVTGPTGSGKTTTIYAFLQILNRESVNIVSLEDPVEYFVEGLNQSQVHPEIGYDFASGLRQILRQDPDIIMVGEIRDDETASLAVQAALTGHIVLSTLHTNNAVGVIPRLMDMKIQPFLLPSALNLIEAQRLVAKLCPYCKVKGDPPAEIKGIIEKEFAEIPEKARAGVQGPMQVWTAPGCAKCKNKGTLGRMALYEIMIMTKELEDIIIAGPTESKIRAEAKRQGMLTLRQDGILKALEGVISMSEVLRETEAE